MISTAPTGPGAAAPKAPQIPFLPFLQRLKQELGYPIDLSKLKQLTDYWLQPEVWLAQPSPTRHLYGLCRVLFLQNPEHDTARFRMIFTNYFDDELRFEQQWMARFGKVQPDPDPSIEKPQTGDTHQSSSGVTAGSSNLTGGNGSQKEKKEEEQKKTIHKYLNLTIPPEALAALAPDQLQTSRFLLTDAYLPLTHREMVRGWRYLRKKEQFRKGNRLDVAATVEHISQNGILLEPIFQPEPVNSESMLLILVDRRGSMHPFHRLCDRMIDTARREGGHRQAQVYYFFNCPMGYVYKNPDLTDAISLPELYSKIRPDQTNALILSDAGAARGNQNPARLKNTQNFLFGDPENESDGGLQKAALFVAWLNPMPKNRWRGSTAAALVTDPTRPLPMFSIMDEGYSAFFKSIQILMGK